MERIWWHLRSVTPSLKKYLQLYNYQIIYNSHTNACNTYFLHYLKIWFGDRIIYSLNDEQRKWQYDYTHAKYAQSTLSPHALTCVGWGVTGTKPSAQKSLRVVEQKSAGVILGVGGSKSALTFWLWKQIISLRCQRHCKNMTSFTWVKTISTEQKNDFKKCIND